MHASRSLPGFKSKDAPNMIEKLPRGHPRVKGWFLGKITDLPGDLTPASRQLDPGHPCAPSRRPSQAGQDADRRRLPGAVGPQIAENLSFVYGKIEIGNRLPAFAPVSHA